MFACLLEKVQNVLALVSEADFKEKFVNLF